MKRIVLIIVKDKMVLNFIPRNPKRKLALLFIGIGILLATPPFINIFIIEDLLNIFIAGFISSKTGISMLNALIFSYTILAWGLILLGFYIYPYNTERLMNGFFNKIKNGIRIYINKVKKQPLHLIWIGVSIFIFFKIYQWYIFHIRLP